MSEAKPVLYRRRLIMATLAGIAAAQQLPKSWVRPVVTSLVLPAHAQLTRTPADCEFGVTVGMVSDPGNVDLADGGTYTAQDAQIRGLVTPPPGALVPLTLQLYANGNLIGDATIPVLPTGEFVTVYFLGTGVGPPGGVERITAHYQCAIASWSATVLPA